MHLLYNLHKASLLFCLQNVVIWPEFILNMPDSCTEARLEIYTNLDCTGARRDYCNYVQIQFNISINLNSQHVCLKFVTGSRKTTGYKGFFLRYHFQSKNITIIQNMVRFQILENVLNP